MECTEGAPATTLRSECAALPPWSATMERGRQCGATAKGSNRGVEPSSVVERSPRSSLAHETSCMHVLSASASGRQIWKHGTWKWAIVTELRRKWMHLWLPIYIWNIVVASGTRKARMVLARVLECQGWL